MRRARAAAVRRPGPPTAGRTGRRGSCSRCRTSRGSACGSGTSRGSCRARRPAGSRCCSPCGGRAPAGSGGCRRACRCAAAGRGSTPCGRAAGRRYGAGCPVRSRGRTGATCAAPPPVRGDSPRTEQREHRVAVVAGELDLDGVAGLGPHQVGRRARTSSLGRGGVRTVADPRESAPVGPAARPEPPPGTHLTVAALPGHAQCGEPVGLDHRRPHTVRTPRETGQRGETRSRASTPESRRSR